MSSTRLGNLGGDRHPGSEDARKGYATYRDQDNPPLPPRRSARGRGGARGVHGLGPGFRQISRARAFSLGGGGPAELSSYDYSDGDGNALGPSVLEDVLSHGTGTTATLLTILSKYAPEVLTSRKLDLAMWKVFSTRGLLADAFERQADWESRPFRLGEAIVDHVRKAGSGPKPDIVSVSLAMNIYAALSDRSFGGIVGQAPWLWVMAAGNDGLDVTRVTGRAGAQTGCFDDVPARLRNDARILCVGALVRGEDGETRIAGYSNYGARVDVYAFQSYDELCPSGTSCATPALTATAAALKATFSTITPEQIKKAIVAAAESRTLEVDRATLPDGVGLGGPRTVRIFDPATMMDQAMTAARSLMASAPQVTPSSWIAPKAPPPVSKAQTPRGIHGTSARPASKLAKRARTNK